MASWKLDGRTFFQRYHQGGKKKRVPYEVKWSGSVVSNSLWPPWTVAYQAPQSMEFSRQEHWSGLPFPSPGDLPNPVIEPRSPALQADTLQSEPPGKPTKILPRRKEEKGTLWRGSQRLGNFLGRKGPEIHLLAPDKPDALNEACLVYWRWARGWGTASPGWMLAELTE